MIVTRFDRLQRELGSLTADQIVLRSIVMVTPLLTMCAAFASSSHWSVWLLLLAAVAALDCATHPETNLGLLVILLLVWHWGATVDDLRTPWTLVAALSIALFHTAMAAAASVPPAGQWSAAMRIVWQRRFGVVAAVTLAVWCLQLALAGSRPAGNAVLLFAALTALAATALLLRAGAVSRR